MLYENFLDSIRLEVEKRLPPGCRVSLVRVQKNNGTPFDGLSFTEKGSRYSPTVYLDAFYQEYLRGMSLEHIARLLIQAYQGGQPVPTRQLEQALDFEMAKTNIVFRLINSNANRDRLGALPHRDFLDLSLIYCLLVDDNEDRQMTSTVTLEQMTAWGITEEELYQLSMENTPRLLPARIEKLSAVIERVTGIPVTHRENDYDLSVLTNQKGLAGDGCILYPGILKDFADRTNNDVVILPSSILEVLLLDLSEPVHFSELNKMIQMINRAEVPREDRLSNHVYLYSRTSDRITIPAGTSACDLTL